MKNLTISERAHLMMLSLKALKLYIQIKVNKNLIRLFNTTPRRIERRHELHKKTKIMTDRLIAEFDRLGVLDEIDHFLPKK